MGTGLSTRVAPPPPHLSTVSFEVAHILKRVCPIHLNEVGVGCCKEVSSCAKAALSTAADTDLFEHADVIDEDVEQSQFLTEAHQYKETAGVECHAVGLFLELLPHIQGPGQTERHTNKQMERLTYVCTKEVAQFTVSFTGITTLLCLMRN